jgi:hypothetical protein
MSGDVFFRFSSPVQHVKLLLSCCLPHRRPCTPLNRYFSESSHLTSSLSCFSALPTLLPVPYSPSMLPAQRRIMGELRMLTTAVVAELRLPEYMASNSITYRTHNHNRTCWQQTGGYCVASIPTSTALEMGRRPHSAAAQMRRRIATSLQHHMMTVNMLVSTV